MSSHCTIRNKSLFCTHCGGEHIIPFPIAITAYTAMMENFIKLHKDCPKTWLQPEVDQTQSEEYKAAWWLAYGERGISSETLFQIISGKKITTYCCHPSDPDDFRRCYLLLKTVPEWKDRLHVIKKLSQEWNNLVDNWDKLTAMLEEQLATGKPNGMLEFMQTLTQQTILA